MTLKIFMGSLVRLSNSLIVQQNFIKPQWALPSNSCIAFAEWSKASNARLWLIPPPGAPRNTKTTFGGFILSVYPTLLGNLDKC
jgi:hypothetical protein